MKSKRLNRVKKVLLSVLATAVLALIAVNVNLAQQNRAMKAYVTLGSVEVLAESEGGGPFLSCKQKISKVKIFHDGGPVEEIIDYTCEQKSGLEDICFEGYEIFYNEVLTYEYKNWVDCY